MNSKASDVSEGVLPCPFCGGEAERFPNLMQGGAPTMARCRQCGAEAFWRKWNRRVSPPLPSLEVERLREALESISSLAEDAFDGSIGAAQAIDAMDDVAKAALSALPLDGGLSSD